VWLGDGLLLGVQRRAGDPLLSGQFVAQAHRARGQDRSFERQPPRAEGPTQKLHSGDDIRLGGLSQRAGRGRGCGNHARTWSDVKKVRYSTDWRTNVNPKYRAREHTFIRSNYNFFKHADKDINAHTNIDPEDLRQWNEIFLLTFIRGHSDLFSNLSWRMRAYYKWMAVQAIGTDLDTLPHAKIIRESDRLSRPQNTN